MNRVLGVYVHNQLPLTSSDGDDGDDARYYTSYQFKTFYIPQSYVLFPIRTNITHIFFRIACNQQGSKARHATSGGAPPTITQGNVQFLYLTGNTTALNTEKRQNNCAVFDD